jgi:hypothetical protein
MLIHLYGEITLIRLKCHHTVLLKYFKIMCPTEARVVAWIQNFLELVCKQGQGKGRGRLRQDQAHLVGAGVAVGIQQRWRKHD